MTSRILAAAAAAVTLLLTASGCAHSESPTSAPTPDAASTPDGARPQSIATRPGQYTAGVDIEPGSWIGTARGHLCTYRKTHRKGASSGQDQLLRPWQYPRLLQESGIPVSGTVRFGLDPGDTLELSHRSPAEPATCNFWKTGPEHSAPAGSDTPWNNTKRAMAPEPWDAGLPEFLSGAQSLVPGADEAELTDMGLWVCLLNGGPAHNYDDVARDALVRFAHIATEHADQLVAAAHNTLCLKQ